MRTSNIYSGLAMDYLNLSEGDQIVDITRDRLEQEEAFGAFLSASVLEERAGTKNELFRKLALHFQKLTLILDVVNDKTYKKQFVNSFQVIP